MEEVRNIMNSYQHRDVKKLLEQKQEQVQAKIREQQVLLERIRATIEDYRIMEENLDVFQVRPMPSMILFHESPADNQAYFNNMIEQENQNPSQAVGSLIESGFIAARGGNRWEMTRLFTAALMPEKQTGRFPENGRLVSVPKAVYTVLRSLGAFAWSRCSRLRWIMLRGRAFRSRTRFSDCGFLPITASRGRWIMWLYICRWINAKPLFLDIIKGKG